jgi:hypothetical protein
VRITSPLPETAFKAPRDSVPVEFAVDAPRDAFGSNDDGQYYVRVGLDWNRDDEFRNESVRPLPSDRQVEVWAKRLLPDGTLTLHADVGDFRINVPATGSGKATDVRAELVTPLGVGASDEVEIRLDGEGPRIFARLRPVVGPDHEIQQGTDLEVHVFTDARWPELSGIDTVEATFETSASGGAKAKWELAKASGAIWIAKLATKDLLPGPHTVLIRAVDKVGNLGSKEEPVTVVPKEVVAPRQQVDPANIVSGQVVYMNQGVLAEIVLESPTGTNIGTQTTRADGRFQFSNVPPGNYVLKATSKSLFGGSRRNGKEDIIVRPRPEPPTSIQSLKLS